MMWNRITICLLLVAFACMTGCAASKVISLWRQQAVAADGNDQEWQGDPQYYDHDRQLAIRTANDARAIFLCIATKDSALKRQLRMAGMTVWLDPGGSNEKIFGIHLSGGDDQRPHRMPRSADSSVHSRRNAPEQPPGMFSEDEKAGSPPMKSLTEVAITYADTTGPLTMKIGEVRRTGIDIGIGQPDDGRLVYEFKIEFTSAPSLNDLEPGMVLGVGILAGSTIEDPAGFLPGEKMGVSFGPGGDARGGPGPGSGKGDGPGGAPPGKDADLFEVWLKVQLADKSFG